MPRISFLKSLVVAGVMALSAQAEAATTFLFNTSGTSFTQGGLTVDVYAQTFNAVGASKTLAAAPGASIVSGASGLGMMLTSGDTNPRVNSFGSTAREAVQFIFSANVHIISATFAGIGGDGAGVGDAVMFTGNTADNLLDGFTVGLGKTFSGPVYSGGNSYAIGGKSGSSFYITSITVETVPLPAGGLLLGSLVVVPFLRRKRQAA